MTAAGPVVHPLLKGCCMTVHRIPRATATAVSMVMVVGERKVRGRERR